MSSMACDASPSSKLIRKLVAFLSLVRRSVLASVATSGAAGLFCDANSAAGPAAAAVPAAPDTTRRTKLRQLVCRISDVLPARVQRVVCPERGTVVEGCQRGPPEGAAEARVLGHSLVRGGTIGPASTDAECWERNGERRGSGLQLCGSEKIRC